MCSNKHFEKLDITRDEFERISNAFKKDDFRKLFFEYCEEIQDPENRKKYEEEITQLEAERGVDVTFLNPEPGFVVKTSLDGDTKCFINISQCDKITAPKQGYRLNPDTGKQCACWSIPHCLPPPRDDLDKKNTYCKVFDVLFHPGAFKIAENNKEFKRSLIDTACDGIEREYKVKLDRTNLKFPKLKFKGIQRASVIRKLSEKQPPPSDEPDPLESIYPPKPQANTDSINVNSTPHKAEPYCTPKYVIKHRRGIDMSEMTYELDAKLNLTIPKELVVVVELPLLKSTADCTLDVTHRKLYLLSEKPAKYKLNIELPYPVNDKDGSASFDTDKRQLVITLPVVTADKEKGMKDFSREDSGVEIDVSEESHSIEEEFTEKHLVEELEAEIVVEDDCPTPPEPAPSFLKETTHYLLPDHFDCNILDDSIGLVINVANVEIDSIEYTKSDKAVHMKFISVGAGFYPTHFAMYFGFPQDSDVTISDAAFESNGINVVVTINVSNLKNVATYFVGVDDKNLKQFQFKETFNTHTKLTKHNVDYQAEELALEISVERLEDNKSVDIEIKQKDVETTLDNEKKVEVVPKKDTNKKQKKKNKKQRSFSESACDDIKQHQQKIAEARNSADKDNSHTIRSENGETEGSQNSPIERNSSEAQDTEAKTEIQIPQARKQRSYSESRDHGTPIFKGILKHYSRYGRTISDSCSSIDEQSSFSCSIDGGLGFAHSFSDIPEENSPRQGLSESCKKTVRFNEVIKKQVFRMDSSILGQRKKNQKRKNKNKQRALQRRHSEGDSIDYEENKTCNSNVRQYLKNCPKGKKNATYDSGLDLSDQYKNVGQTTPSHTVCQDVELKNTLMFDIDM